MKVKTSELQGAPLNWAVAQILELPLDDLRTSRSVVFYLGEPWVPDIYWEQGGVIIEEEKIALSAAPEHWSAYVARGTREIAGITTPNWTFKQNGPTPLIAAMRCYVASQIGDEVDVPEVLFSDK
jgi:hypothetical protein